MPVQLHRRPCHIGHALEARNPTLRGRSHGPRQNSKGPFDKYNSCCTRVPSDFSLRPRHPNLCRTFWLFSHEPRRWRTSSPGIAKQVTCQPRTASCFPAPCLDQWICRFGGTSSRGAGRTVSCTCGQDLIRPASRAGGVPGGYR